MQTIKVREGKKEDLPGVLRLIRELADYEKAPQEVVVTLEEMQEWGFGKEPIFKFFVAELFSEEPRVKSEEPIANRDSIVGIALYYIKYSTWKGKCVFLDDLIVTEKYRRHGIGRMLFDEVAKASKAMKVRKMEWQVLDWNTPAIEFYKKYNAHFDGEWINCKLTDEELKLF